MKRALRAVPLFLLALSAACAETPVVCPLTVDPSFAVSASLQVAVVDSITGQSVVPGARGRWITGTETDSLRHGGNVLFGYGPAGRYAVAVEAPGYRPWARSDVRVRAGECGPVLEELTARLQPEVHPPAN